MFNSQTLINILSIILVIFGWSIFYTIIKFLCQEYLKEQKLKIFQQNLPNIKLQKYKEIFNKHFIRFQEYELKNKQATVTLLQIASTDIFVISFHGIGKSFYDKPKMRSSCSTKILYSFELQGLKSQNQYIFNKIFLEAEWRACQDSNSDNFDKDLELIEQEAEHLVKLLTEKPKPKENSQFQEAIAFFNLSIGFSKTDLKTAYRKKLMKAHPDHGGSREQMDQVKNHFHKLNEKFNK